MTRHGAANRAVFLDRDGTLIEEVGYLDRLDRMRLFPESIDALRLLQRAGFRLIIATNQSGIAQGLFTETFVRDLHHHLTELLARGGVKLDGVYYCPHHPEAKLEQYREVCDCRKPGAGLLRQAERDMDLDLARSYMIGDRWRDLQAGQAVGTAAVLMRTGYGASEEANPLPGARADATVDNLAAAASWILLREQTASL
jgi:D-glycero-D-manno-heptose 1,7-bisphosphate phosphatase